MAMRPALSVDLPSARGGYSVDNGGARGVGQNRIGRARAPDNPARTIPRRASGLPALFLRILGGRAALPLIATNPINPRRDSAIPMTTIDEPNDSDERRFKLSSDLKQAAALMTPDEARFIVARYYDAQDDRLRSAGRIRASDANREPHAILTWFAERQVALENAMRGALHVYAKASPLGRWALSIYGIGPVITAGLLAHIDVTRSSTVGNIWRFAGLDASCVWLGREGAEKLVAEVVPARAEVTESMIRTLGARGPFLETTLRRMAAASDGKITRASLVRALARRPWNADLKRLCYLIGTGFVKLRTSEKDDYGKFYDRRKAYEVNMNESGAYKATADAVVASGRIKDAATLARYKEGKLPDGRIHLRAMRHAVKLFLSHYHAVGWELAKGVAPPKPWVLTYGEDHTDYIAPFHWPMVG
jgi:hypothetical protein